METQCFSFTLVFEKGSHLAGIYEMRSRPCIIQRALLTLPNCTTTILNISTAVAFTLAVAWLTNCLANHCKPGTSVMLVDGRIVWARAWATAHLERHDRGCSVYWPPADCTHFACILLKFNQSSCKLLT